MKIQPVSEDVAVAFGLEVTKGAMIADIVEDTPAQVAGIEKGDIVLSVDGREVKSPRDLTRMIAGQSPGKTVTLNLLHKGQARELSVRLGDRRERPA
ncbi:serine protease DO-like precursor [Roseobacter sp. AzwK-3b]|nr:serine protease DO-like precursor [Roseobacter sp. AzwK-3b]